MLSQPTFYLDKRTLCNSKDFFLIVHAHHVVWNPVFNKLLTPESPLGVSLILSLPVKHWLQCPWPWVSGSEGLGWGWEFTFLISKILISSLVMLCWCCWSRDHALRAIVLRRRSANCGLWVPGCLPIFVNKGFIGTQLCSSFTLCLWLLLSYYSSVEWF